MNETFARSADTPWDETSDAGTLIDVFTPARDDFLDVSKQG